MCVYNKLAKTKAEIEARYKATFENDFQPVHVATGFTHPKWPVITGDKSQSIQQFHWGLIPSWVKTPEQANEIRIPTLNARSETAFELASFKNAIVSKRCLIPSDGFYEWMEVKKQKYPHHIQLKGSPVFSMAGIWDSWVNRSSGELVNTFSILTCDANPLMRKIHNAKKRMPVILSPSQERQWLQNDLTKEEIRKFFLPYPEEEMEAWTVSRKITARDQDPNVPEVSKKFFYPELEQPTLF